MRTFNYDGREVVLEKTTYRNNGTLAVMMKTADGDYFETVTVNLCHPMQSESMAFLDENNLPGIGKWIERNHIGVNMGVKASSGFCLYPLFTLFEERM